MTHGVSMTIPQMKRCECTVDGATVRLTPKMERVVSLLLLRPGHIIPYREVIEYVYPDCETEPDTAWNCIMQFICRADRSLKQRIRAVPRRGLIMEWPRAAA